MRKFIQNERNFLATIGVYKLLGLREGARVYVEKSPGKHCRCEGVENKFDPSL
jgi:hypothetical protein